MEIKGYSWQQFIRLLSEAQLSGLKPSKGTKIGMGTYICEVDGEPLETLIEIPEDAERKTKPINILGGMGSVIEDISNNQDDGWFLVGDSGLRISSGTVQVKYAKIVVDKPSIPKQPTVTPTKKVEKEEKSEEKATKPKPTPAPKKPKAKAKAKPKKKAS